MVDTALVEGAICDTIDFSRSVILMIVYTGDWTKKNGVVKCEDVEDAETATLTSCGATAATSEPRLSDTGHAFGRSTIGCSTSKFFYHCA
jgi:hypothetical protein